MQDMYTYGQATVSSNCKPIGMEASTTHLSREDNLVADAALLHPLPKELLRGLVLVVVRRVDEVPSGIVERVEEREARLLVHRAHAELLPFVADARRAELERRDVHPSEGGELAVEPELGWGRRWGGEEIGHCAWVCRIDVCVGRRVRGGGSYAGAMCFARIVRARIY